MEFTINRSFVTKVLLITLVLGLLLFLNGTSFAQGDADLPWNSNLDKLIKAFSGRTAVLISAVGLFVLAGMAIFGGDLGVVGKGLMMVIIAGSIMTGLIKIAETFVGKGFNL